MAVRAARGRRVSSKWPWRMSSIIGIISPASKARMVIPQKDNRRPIISFLWFQAIGNILLDTGLYCLIILFF